MQVPSHTNITPKIAQIPLSCHPLPKHDPPLRTKHHWKLVPSFYFKIIKLYTETERVNTYKSLTQSDTDQIGFESHRVKSLQIPQCTHFCIRP